LLRRHGIRGEPDYATGRTLDLDKTYRTIIREIARPVMMALPDLNVSGANLSELIGKMNVELTSDISRTDWSQDRGRCAG
jgi:hypothetical protein